MFQDVAARGLDLHQVTWIVQVIRVQQWSVLAVGLITGTGGFNSENSPSWDTAVSSCE